MARAPSCRGTTISAPTASSDEDVNLFPNVTLYPDTEVGKRVRIHSGTVVGSDGFGYVLDNGIHRKVPADRQRDHLRRRGDRRERDH